MRTCLMSLAVMLMLLGCTSQPPSVPVVRLDQAVAEFDEMSAAGKMALADSLAPEMDAYFAVLGHPAPTLETISWWSESREVEMFQPDVDKVFPTLGGLESEIGYILSEAQRQGLELPPLTFASVVWGKPQPIRRVGDIVLIALNHYLGADYPGYSHWEAYRRVDKEPWAMQYDVAAVLAATQHPYEVMPDSQTLLSWMLYEGALMQARMVLVRDARLDRALGYTAQQLEFVEAHEQEIWREMAARKLIYDTDPATIDRYIGAAPSTPLMGGQAPGRVGRYIGYKIVKAYLRQHPSTSLSQLLSPSFYANTQSLIDSGY